MSSKLSQILNNLRSQGFLELELTDLNYIKNFKLLHLGDLLHRNIRYEWVRGTESTLHTDSTLHADELKEAANIENPFYPYSCNDYRIKNYATLKNHNRELPFANIEEFKLKTDTCIFNYLQYSHFVPQNVSMQMLNSIQRKRKIWWTLLASNPEKLIISNPTVDPETNIRSLTINARYDFGDLELENIDLIPLKQLPDKSGEGYKIHHPRTGEYVIPDVIRCRMNLEKATMGVLIDASDSSLESKKVIHRSIAPYQCSIIGYTSDKRQLAALQDLAEFLRLILQKFPISIVTPRVLNTNKTPLNSQYSIMDNIGVPYIVHFDEESLHNGIIKLRNRDTTSTELIHISDLPEQLANYLKS